MNSIILRTTTKFLLLLMLIFSIFTLLRGHNEPGGGFAGGLIAASGFSLYLIAFGPQAIRKLLRFNFRYYIAAGLTCTLVSGMLGLFMQQAFLTGKWIEIKAIHLTLGTPLLFDLGVYLVVIGSILKVIISLEEKEK